VVPATRTVADRTFRAVVGGVLVLVKRVRAGIVLSGCRIPDLEKTPRQIWRLMSEAEELNSCKEGGNVTICQEVTDLHNVLSSLWGRESSAALNGSPVA
jgi:hypothetical protein